MSKQQENHPDSISLNKYISSTGFCSRREADKLIEQARVTINDELVLAGARVMPGDIVEVDGEPLKKKKSKAVYIAFNKPIGVTSTSDTKDPTNIVSFISHPKRIFPIGRLDKDSDGLILLTDDGDIVNKILRAENNHEKEYIVVVDKPVTAEFVQGMSNGVPVLGEVTKKCKVKQEGNKRFRITLTQGLNRQIRRMCEHFGYKVEALTRVRIMNISLGSLPSSRWRYLTDAEMAQLNVLLADSSNVSTPPVPKEKKQYIPKRKPRPTTPPATPTAKPAAKPSVKPTAKPTGKSTAKPIAKITAKPTGKPQKSTGKPAPKNTGKQPRRK